MKVLVFALLLLVAVAYVEALQCHVCAPDRGASGQCVGREVTCRRPNSVCVTLVGSVPARTLIRKRCVRAGFCKMLENKREHRGRGRGRHWEATCCDTDNCNAV